MEDALIKFAKETFGEKVTKFDYKLFAAIVDLFGTLPKSHGISSIVKVLKGTSKAVKSNKHFGMVEGMKGYSYNKLRIVVERVNMLMSDSSLVHYTDLPYDENSDEYAPEWLDNRNTCDYETDALFQFIMDLGEREGVDVAVPEKNKQPDLKKAKDLVNHIPDRVYEDAINLLKQIEKEKIYEPYWSWGGIDEYIEVFKKKRIPRFCGRFSKSNKKGNFSLTWTLTDNFNHIPSKKESQSLFDQLHEQYPRDEEAMYGNSIRYGYWGCEEWQKDYDVYRKSLRKVEKKKKSIRVNIVVDSELNILEDWKVLF